MILDNEKICALDLDDTLSHSTEFWIDYVNNETNNKFKTLKDIKETLSYTLYSRLKFQYRICGIKIDIKPINDALITTELLKKNGYKIIIITSRPYFEIPELGKITYNWLEKNKIIYDAVIFNKKKYIEIIQKYPNIKFYVDDNRNACNLVAKYGYLVFLLNNNFNQGDIEKNVVRIEKLSDIFQKIKEC